jgi:hypothetical protein
MSTLEVREYQTAAGKSPLAAWLGGLRDGATRSRIYYGQEGKTLILLLCGGDKSTQAKDIETAHAYWKDYKARLPKPTVQSSGTPAKRG